jgi:geranylgeranyl pyrophosphate synthase
MDVSQSDLIEISEKKTGALFAWTIESMAILGNKSESFQKMAHTLGLKIGIVFQMMDDNLDFSKESGKDFAKDIKEGLLNFTAIELLTLFPALSNSLYQMRGQDIESYPWTEDQIAAAINSVKNKIQVLQNEITEILQSFVTNEPHLNNDHYREILKYMQFLIKREN